MTNTEIITNEILINKLMTKEELEEYINTNFQLPNYLTYKQWQKKGYTVKKGEKAIIKTKLWIRTKKKIDKEKEENDENIIEGFTLANTSLFGENQVEKLEVK